MECFDELKCAATRSPGKLFLTERRCSENRSAFCFFVFPFFFFLQRVQVMENITFKEILCKTFQIMYGLLIVIVIVITIERETLSNNMSRIKVHMNGRQRSEFKIWKLIRIKIQVLPTGTHSLVGKASALEKPRNWVRVLASVRFFICSVASFLLCCPCDALEGPI